MPEERILQAFRSDEPHGRCSTAHTASSCMITDQRVIFVKRTSGGRGYTYINQAQHSALHSLLVLIEQSRSMYALSAVTSDYGSHSRSFYIHTAMTSHTL